MSNDNETQSFKFTNERDAVAFARSHGGPIKVEVIHEGRGDWTVEISPMEVTRGNRVVLK